MRLAVPVQWAYIITKSLRRRPAYKPRGYDLTSRRRAAAAAGGSAVNRPRLAAANKVRPAVSRPTVNQNGESKGKKANRTPGCRETRTVMRRVSNLKYR
ncbi:hypothetical protein EVAR_27830_1 [Eumeta japonica]|uniref:Uncharacterized protein n=1 Tax=Eumeta variegata TaxID=151549 RepID=A0A4C1VJ81_EUMVA|nr:hypothetical protein EVAR_27830_1 [Eumeta japonica]